MKYSDIPSAQIAVQCARKMGIDRVVISPGSRNAPLTLSFTNDPYFSCYSIVDERSAGFFALGMAREIGKPVILVCTSGSALLNYYPAVAEAYYSRIPLIVLSADRPPYKIDIGDGQTIRQPGVLQTHCDCNFNLQLDIVHATDEQFAAQRSPVPEEEVLLRRQAEIQHYNLSQVTSAYAHALKARGPVHVNIPFEEPLYGRTAEWKVHDIAWTPKEIEEVLPDQLKTFQKQWQHATRKMVLIGVSDPGEIPDEWCEAWVLDPSVIVFTETTSNLTHDSFFPSIDSIIAPIEKSRDSDLLFKHLKPELIVTIGGLIVSKKVKAFLRKYSPDSHWHIGSGPSRATFFIPPKHIPHLQSNLFPRNAAKDDRKTEYRSLWKGVKEQYKTLRDRYLEEISHTDFTAFASVLSHIPETYSVHFSNSSPIRYAQLFEMKSGLRVYCNRGTSGIEGCSSTAVGAAAAEGRPTVLVTGDLGFLYDSNAFWNGHVPSNFRIIVINNSGGGIFRILPGKEDSEVFERYFETKHARTAKSICEAHDIMYQSVSSRSELEASWKEFYSGDKPRLLEIMTPRTQNDRILLEYFDFLSSNTTYNPLLIETPDGEQKR